MSKTSNRHDELVLDVFRLIKHYSGLDINCFVFTFAPEDKDLIVQVIGSLKSFGFEVTNPDRCDNSVIEVSYGLDTCVKDMAV